MAANENQQSNKELVQALCQKDAIFSQVFNNYLVATSIPPEITKKAKQLFETVCPEKKYEDFLAQWNAEKVMEEIQKNTQNDPLIDSIADNSVICPQLAFDPRSRKNVRPFAAPPVRLGGRRKIPEFDVYKFLTEKDENEEGFALKMDCYADEDEIFDCAYEEPEKEYMMADQSLRKIASLVAELNNSCNYRMMDIQGEARVR